MLREISNLEILAQAPTVLTPGQLYLGSTSGDLACALLVTNGAHHA